MNKKQELQLEYAAINLTRADQDNNLQSMTVAHKAIRKAVIEIYMNKSDVPTVLQVERILNRGLANALEKATDAYKEMGSLEEQAGIGLSIYRLFAKMPGTYVKFAYATREGVKKGKPFFDKIPYDPVRSALTEFREQLTQELTPRKGNPFPDSKETDRMRFDATVKAERNYLEDFLKHKSNEPGQNKQEHLQNFDKRMERLMRKIEPGRQENNQNRRNVQKRGSAGDE